MKTNKDGCKWGNYLVYGGVAVKRLWKRGKQQYYKICDI